MAKNASQKKKSFRRIVFTTLRYIVVIYVAFYAGLVSYRDTIAPIELSGHTPPTRAELLKLVNVERAKAGVAPLRKDVSLDVSAQMKAEDMDSNNYFAHVDKYGKQGYSYIIDVVGTETCKYVSENIVFAETPEGNNAKTHIHSWMSSDSHRKALLDPKYGVTGFGISGNYVVQHFCQVR